MRALLGAVRHDLEPVGVGAEDLEITNDNNNNNNNKCNNNKQ